jgi:pimeloyl-ACP methyl ester carboxylesterase
MAFGDETMEAVLRSGPFPDVPLVVLTSGKQLLTSANFYEVWVRTQKDLANLSNESTHNICTRCGHYIHRDNPELVIDAIEDVILSTREKSELTSNQ